MTKKTQAAKILLDNGFSWEEIAALFDDRQIHVQPAPLPYIGVPTPTTITPIPNPHWGIGTNQTFHNIANG